LSASGIDQRVIAMLEPIVFIALIVLLVWATQGDPF
jgi:hypothetical protein